MEIRENKINMFESNIFQNEFAYIKFDNDNLPQKFVELLDQKGNICIASYPQVEAKFHVNVLMKANEYFKTIGKTIQLSGAGFLTKNGNKIKANGESKQFNKSFDKINVKNFLEKNFPNCEIIVE